MSQQIKDIENTLTNVYIKIYKEIKKDPAYPFDLAALQLAFTKLVYDNTRSAIEQAVLKGSQKVNRKLKTQPFISQTDLDIIKKKTDEQVASFWRKLQLDMNREQENITLAQTNNELKPRLDTNSYLNAVATAAAFSSFAVSTMSKLRELEPEKPKVKWVATVDSKTCDELPDGAEGCKQRNGRIYDADDPELQDHTPGSGTHAYCRCTLEPII
jgi:SPP1 gp7 family putative phage head morphogenesis protein